MAAEQIVDIKAPFSYFGGKRTIAAEVWRRLGDVPNYVEPFFGSGAVLLCRPSKPKTETVNDADGMVANFWRAVQHDPDAVAKHADNPVNECDLHARHIWLVNRKDSLQAKLEGAPDYYDAKIAGWWCWGLCCWIGSGWCSGKGPWNVANGEFVKTGYGQGVIRQLPHLGDGRGVKRKLPHLGDGQGVKRKNVAIRNWMMQLSDRLRRVRVCCGDWSRVCGPSVTTNHGTTGVFLDPPYSHDMRESGLYRIDSSSVAANCLQWCIENGDNIRLRIALCGYAGEHDELESLGWRVWKWKAHGGYANQNSQGNDNRTLERIWFSPACIEGRAKQSSLF